MTTYRSVTLFSQCFVDLLWSINTQHTFCSVTYLAFLALVFSWYIRRSKRQKIPDEGSWDCSVCTYKNSPEAYKCEMCDVRKGTSTRYAISCLWYYLIYVVLTSTHKKKFINWYFFIWYNPCICRCHTHNTLVYKHE